MEIETDLSSTLYQEIYSICEARFSFAVTRLAKILSLLQNLDSSNIFLLSTMLVLISFSFLVYRVPPSRRLKLQSAQLIKCRHQLALLMKEKSCSPLFLRLAWTDAATYDASIHEWPNSGGCTGSVHFEESLQHPANKGLDKAITMLNPFKQTYNLISWADLIQMAGSLAVEICGGPDLQNSMIYGRIDALAHQGRMTAAVSCPARVGSSPRAEYGRLPMPEPPYPDGAPTSAIHIRNTFYRMGFTNKETVALMGAHTIGRAFKDRSGVCENWSGDAGATAYTRPTWIAKANGAGGIGMAGGCSWTKNWLHFDNSYFKRGVGDVSSMPVRVEGDGRDGEKSSVHKSTSHAANNIESSVGRVPAHERVDSVESHEKKSIVAPFAVPPMTHARAIGEVTASDRRVPLRATPSPGRSAPHLHSRQPPVPDKELLWLSTDRALHDAPEFRVYFLKYAKDQQAFFDDYAAAHKKMSELGTKFSPPCGISLPSFSVPT